MKVLIADDQPVTLRRLSGLVTNWGYDVITANNGEGAWRTLKGDEALYLALLDRQMPGRTGDEVCRLARLHLHNRPLHLIMITATCLSVEEKVNGLGAGADDYLTQPYAPAELRARLKVGERIIGLQLELRERVAELESALAQVHQLQGLLPICMDCKKIRDDQNYWHQVEHYVAERTAASFTHSLCPTCFHKRVQELETAKWLTKEGETEEIRADGEGASVTTSVG